MNTLQAPWTKLLARRAGEAILLWSGSTDVLIGDETLPGRAQVRLRMHTSPRIAYRFATREFRMGQFGAPMRLAKPPGNVTVPPFPARIWGPGGPRMQHRFSTDGVVEVFDFGDPVDLSSLVFGLTDFTALLHQHEWFDDEQGTRACASWMVNEWKVTMIGRDSARDDWWKPHEGSSAITHAVGITRGDGQSFHADDARELIHALLLVLSFANGSLVGCCIPTGYDSNSDVQWLQWSVTQSDGLSFRLTWYDHTLWESLGELAASFLTQSIDDFRRQVLTRIIRMRVSASNPNPIDPVIPTAFSALELAASANNTTPRKLNPKSNPSTADDIRGLLDWLTVSTAFPPEMTKLADYGKKHQHPDVAAAINGVRNRLVHPPKKTSDWPASEVMIDAWRTAMEFVDLSVLRMLDYTGSYGHMRHNQGRFVGDVTPVPWTSTP